jgi:hypothetical protein
MTEKLASQGFQRFFVVRLKQCQLLSNPAIKLTSNPSRSQGEIVGLLGEQLLVVANGAQSKNTSQLL